MRSFDLYLALVGFYAALEVAGTAALVYLAAVEIRDRRKRKEVKPGAS